MSSTPRQLKRNALREVERLAKREFEAALFDVRCGWNEIFEKKEPLDITVRIDHKIWRP